MTETHVVSALRNKRAEIAGQIANLENRAHALRARLVHLDDTIRLFASDLDPADIPPRRVRQRSRYFTSGEFSRLLLNTLRKRSGTPAKASEMAADILTAKQYPASDPALLGATAKRAQTLLRTLARRGVVAKLGDKRTALWVLADKNHLD